MSENQSVKEGKEDSDRGKWELKGPKGNVGKVKNKDKVRQERKRYGGER